MPLGAVPEVPALMAMAAMSQVFCPLEVENEADGLMEAATDWTCHSVKWPSMTSAPSRAKPVPGLQAVMCFGFVS